MATTDDMLTVNATINIPAAALQAVVDKAKQQAGKDADGAYRVDTHAKLGELISRFLMEKDFLAYAQNIQNYD